MTVAVNVCANAYDKKAQPQGPPTLWLTVTRRCLATADSSVLLVVKPDVKVIMSSMFAVCKST
jgi:hypothetical protein